MDSEKLKTHIRLCLRNLRSDRVKCCGNCPFEEEITREYPETKDMFKHKRERGTSPMNNPKLAGTHLVDCIPQEGECPNHCVDCFYNSGRFYRPLKPLFPDPALMTHRTIVRVNSGHDSNIEKEHVVSSTSQYANRFFNTSIPNFDFPGPVVFTCNPKEEPILYDGDISNVMFVRVRMASWEKNMLRSVVEYYTEEAEIGGVPIVVTFMRFYNKSRVREPEKYEWKKSILNEYWILKPEHQRKIMEPYKDNRFVSMCGSPGSSLCTDCLNCETYYWQAIKRMRLLGNP